MYVLARLPRLVQWGIALLLTVICLGILGLFFALPIVEWRRFPLLVVVPWIVPPLESFLITPLYALLGRYRYYSPLLFATRRADGGLDLHVGTLFDYVMRLRWRDRGARAMRIVTADLLRGLLAPTEEIEHGRL